MAILGAGWVAVHLLDLGPQINLARFDAGHWLGFLILAMIYGVAGGALGLAWRELLSWLGTSTSRCWAVRVYGLSQIAKYLPGNVFHLASRQGLGLSAGVSGWLLAKSAVWDLGMLAAAGALFTGLLVPLAWPGSMPIFGPLFFLVGVGSLAGLLGAMLGLPVVRALLWDVFFLLVSGILFVVLLALLGALADSTASLLFSVLGAYVLSWLVGFLTPGVPAGVGVREVLLMFLLNESISESELGLAIILIRLVTLVGDMLFFCLAILLRCENRQATSASRKSYA